MKTLKIMVAAILIAASFNAPVMAQDKQKTDNKSATTAPAPKLKEHKCNANCTAAGHSYVHGEKGHVCTAECKKMTTKKA